MAQESITRTFELIATRSLVIPKDPDEECILDLNLDEMIIDAPDEEDQKKTVASLLHTKLLKPEIRISSRLLTEAESIDFREVKITPASGIENTVYQKVCVNIIDDKLINYSYTVTTVKKDNARNIFRIIVWQPLTYDHICDYYIESESGRSISPLRISAAAHENHASADNDETASYDEDNPPQEPKEEQELSAPDKHPEQELNASSEETAADEGQNGPEEQCTETNPELQQQGEADSDEEENRLDLEVKLEEDYPDPALERLITQSDEPELGDLSQLNYLINEQTEPELKVQVPVVQHNRYESETDEIQTENRPDVRTVQTLMKSMSTLNQCQDLIIIRILRPVHVLKVKSMMDRFRDRIRIVSQKFLRITVLSRNCRTKTAQRSPNHRTVPPNLTAVTTVIRCTDRTVPWTLQRNPNVSIISI